MRRVICIKKYDNNTKHAMIVNGIVPPEPGDEFHVNGEDYHDNIYWYTFSEYPDMLISVNQFARHYFEQEYFADVTNLHEEIQTALLAPKPLEPIKEPDFKLSEKELHKRLLEAKCYLMGAQDYKNYRYWRDVVAELYFKLQNLKGDV